MQTASQGIVGTVGNLAAAFKNAWEEAGLGTHVIQGVWDTANIVLQYVKDVWADISEWAQNLNFTPLLEAFDGLAYSVKDLLDPSGALYQIMRDIWTKVLLPIGKWLVEKGLPKAINLITAAVKLLGGVLESLKPVLDWLANEMIPDVGKFLSGAFSGIADFVIDDIETIAKQLKGENVTSLFGGFWDELFDTGNDLNGAFWEDWLNGAKDIVSDSSLSRQMQSVGEKLFDFGQGIKDWWKESVLGETEDDIAIKIKPVLSGTDSLTNPLEEDWAPDTGFSEFIETWGQGIDVIRNFFSTEWNGYIEAWGNGWQSIKDSASEMWNGVVETWSTGWTTIKDTASYLWNGFVESWQSIITALSAIAPYANGLKVNKSFEQSVEAIGAGIVKLNSFGEISLSDNTLASIEMFANAIPSLSALAAITKELNISSNFAESIESLGKALQSVNSLGNVSLSEDTIVSIKKLNEAISGLSSVSANANGFKVGKSFANSIDTISENIPKLNALGSSGDVSAASENVQNLNNATANLKSVAENINSFDIGKGFSVSVDVLKAAITQLESLSNTGELTKGIENECFR